MTGMEEPGRGPDRRLLLGLGAAALLSGCGSAAASPQKSAAPSPSPSPSRHMPSRALRRKCVAPSAQELAGRVPQSHVPCSAADVALTIDDGPDPEWTPKVLALLQRLDIRATFCVIGRQAASHPDLVAAVAGAGHMVANHTYTHRFLAAATREQIHSEIARASDAVAAATGGHAPKLFRAPGGEWTHAVLSECAAQGLRPLGWSVDPRDWSRPGTTSIVRTLLHKTVPGSIILEHDGGGNRSQTLQALTVALPRLLDAGFRFVQP
jgi:peptidoglycan/xylan/chitin deacetylase (PgdA/CDA1 family)